MTLHRAQHGWITRNQRTTNTECGRRVACCQIAIDADTDCAECRAAVDRELASIIQCADSYVAAHGFAKVAVDARVLAAAPNRYRTVYFLSKL